MSRARSGGQRGLWMERLGGPILALGSVVLGIALVEIVLRAAGVDFNPQPHLRDDRHLGWVADPAGDYFDAVNEHGFRGASPTAARRDAVRRLLVPGDSFSFAGAFPYAQTYPGLLERWLNDTQETWWEVVNLSRRNCQKSCFGEVRRPS